MKTQKDDRRSLRTQQLLSHALTELMQEKSYEAISVQDILDRANVGRSTFYSHYQDKEDLLVSSLEHVMHEFIRHIEENGQLTISTEAFFRHVQENERLYKAMVWGRGIDMLFNKGQAQLSRRIEEHLAASMPAASMPAASMPAHAAGATDPGVPLPVVATFLSGAFLTLLKWWVETKMVYTPKQMSEMYQRLAMYGAMGAIRPDR